MPQTIQQFLQVARQQLQAHVEDPYTDSHVLMGHCLQKDRAWLLAHADDELQEHRAEEFVRLVEKRRQGVPVAHLTGSREFWSMEFKVTADTLIPRPETEHLIEQVLALPLPASGIRMLDFGTGSGVIAITVKKERPAWQVTAMDCSAAALQVARHNADRHNAAIDFIQACNLESFSEHRFDLIVSNPPYIEENDPHLAQGDVRFEPQMALVSGSDGLDCIRSLVVDAPACLNPSAYLVMEHGYDQGNAVRELLNQQGYEKVQTHKDLGGHERITSAQWAA
ncbi:MAG: peptide chain release factor N(5)-glutamine methyltransferase [Gammaproteobacteria bacterium]|nr:peptide chain release factor N(5)-glutamine methyltransferase [Gammaproteobacteria bacterium]